MSATFVTQSWAPATGASLMSICVAADDNGSGASNTNYTGLASMGPLQRGPGVGDNPNCPR